MTWSNVTVNQKKWFYNEICPEKGRFGCEESLYVMWLLAQEVFKMHSIHMPSISFWTPERPCLLSLTMVHPRLSAEHASDAPYSRVSVRVAGICEARHPKCGSPGGENLELGGHSFSLMKSGLFCAIHSCVCRDVWAVAPSCWNMNWFPSRSLESSKSFGSKLLT